MNLKKGHITDMKTGAILKVTMQIGKNHFWPLHIQCYPTEIALRSCYIFIFFKKHLSTAV